MNTGTEEHGKSTYGVPWSSRIVTVMIPREWTFLTNHGHLLTAHLHHPLESRVTLGEFLALIVPDGQTEERANS